MFEIRINNNYILFYFIWLEFILYKVSLHKNNKTQITKKKKYFDAIFFYTLKFLVKTQVVTKDKLQQNTDSDKTTKCDER